MSSKNNKQILPRYFSSFDNAAIGVALVSIEGKWLKVNKVLCDGTGYTEKELLATDFQSITHPDDLNTDLNFVQQMLDKKIHSYQMEKRYLHKNGSYIWVLLTVSLLWNESDTPLYFIAQIQDINERKCAERELQLVNERLAIAANTARIGVWDWDIDNKTIVWDEWMYRLYNKNRTADAELYSCWTDSLHPEDRQHAEASLHAALRGESDYDCEFRIIWPNEEIRYIKAFASLVSKNNTERRMIGVNFDITDRKRSENALKKITIQAQEANIAKSQFLANMSHEIRTPMNAVLGMLQLLKQTNLSEHQIDYVTKSIHAANSLTKLLNDILDFSKVEAGKMILDNQLFSMEKLLGDLSVITSERLGSKNILLLFDIHPAIPQTLLGDELKLKQVLTNLITNAIKFTADGQVILKVDIVEEQPEQVNLVFSVKDTGIGISPENQKIIANGFTPTESSTTRGFGGIGLGLTISKKLVEMMGGKLSLKSNLHEGSEFYFNLSFSVEQNESSHCQDNESLHVLIVDSNVMSQNIILKMANTLGWNADIATNRIEAINLFKAGINRKTTYQVIFINCNVLKNEPEVLFDLRHLPRSEDINLIITGSMHNIEKYRMYEWTHNQVINNFLIMPHTRTMLLQSVIMIKPKIIFPPSSASQAMERLSGLRILIIEDNLPNQKVAKELLDYEGAYVVVASSAQEGIAAIKKAKIQFDVVLMDSQMPDMDCYQATKIIHKQPGLESLPIIALTVNATPSDRKKALKAGMSDHISKSIKFNNLVEVIRQNCIAETKKITHKETVLISEKLQANAKLRGISIYNAIKRFGGKIEIYIRSCEMFLNDISKIPHQLELFFIKEKCEEAHRLIHSTRGLADTLGADQLAKLLSDNELILQGKPGIKECLNLLPSIVTAIAIASHNLHYVINHLKTDSHKSPVKEEVENIPVFEDLIEQLIQLLRQDNTDVHPVFALCKKYYADVFENDFETLEEAINKEDFEQALIYCLKIKSRYTG